MILFMIPLITSSKPSLSSSSSETLALFVLIWV
eukprot:CAMPEP_0118672732 /NCGR_PEP_ID=MMETSP0785-20121206/22705_1 /TAXON_ID=91992 /ORGANISM="Bolidomonas pacifica, Strain CCMP 1866" /LENGTH=32 /DNA_ID= /DNA_START= /DNA_END= /DNA_ORIENTATION=